LAQHILLINGFGVAGAALALALHQGGFDASDIAILDGAKHGGSAGDARFIALNTASRRFLEGLGIWQQLAEACYPMARITLSDTALEEEIRPPLLDFTPADEGEAPAHLVSLPKLHAALRAACHAAGMPVYAQTITHFEAGLAGAVIKAGEEVHHASLVVAADGAQSPLRTLAGLPFYTAPYPQIALVATIRHSAPHEGEGVQHFLPAGSFAILPLDEYRSSLVWSEKPEVAAIILAADPAYQKAEIARRAAGWRGDVEAVEALSSHPLSLGLARDFIGARLALVADAAHVVHPLAGQGLNLGLADVASLASLVLDHARLGLDVGEPALLEAYQARRRPPAVAMAMMTDSLNRLFSNDLAPLRLLRDAGMGLVNRSPWLKMRLMQVAAG
jgi:2-octaprenyl-6-methoxyphenol hydroxylase